MKSQENPKETNKTHECTAQAAVSDTMMVGKKNCFIIAFKMRRLISAVFVCSISCILSFNFNFNYDSSKEIEN